MRVLFTAFGAHGHIRPMCSVAEGLAGSGHDVLFATSAACPPSLYVQAARLHHRHSIRPSPVTEALRTHEIEHPGAPTLDSARHRSSVTGPHVLRAAVTALLEFGLAVTVSTGDQQLREELEGLDGRRVEATPWVDLVHLLPDCRVAVCHGGAGTVLRALAAGVPLVLVPQGARSQARMSAACEARGLARTVCASAARSAVLGAAVAEVTSDDRFMSAAAAVAPEIAGMPEPSAAVPVLESLVGDRRA